MSLADQLRKIQGSNKERVEADAPSSSLLALFTGQSSTEPTTRKRTRNSLEDEPVASPPTKKLRRQVATTPVDEESSSSEEESSQEAEDEPSALSTDEQSHEEALADAPEATESKTTKEEDEAQKAAQRERDQRTLFLGNLPTNTKKKDLRALCATYGKIESIRFRSVPVASPKLPKKVALITKQFSEKLDDLHAYVVFVTAAEATAAQALNGHVFRERHIRADVAANQHKKLDNDCSVFVGNLAYDVTDEALWSHFADCGEVKAVRVVRDPQYRIGKGFGYVMFDTPLAVNRALKLDTKKMDGRPLRVSRSVRNKAKNTGKEKKGGSRGPPTRHGKQGGKQKGQAGSFIQVAKARDQAPAKKKKKTSLGEVKSFEGKRAVPGKSPRLTLPTWKKEEKKKKAKTGPRKPRHKKTKNKT